MPIAYEGWEYNLDVVEVNRGDAPVRWAGRAFGQRVQGAPKSPEKGASIVNVHSSVWQPEGYESREQATAETTMQVRKCIKDAIYDGL